MVFGGVTGNASNNSIAGPARKVRIEEAEKNEGARMTENTMPDETLLRLAKEGDEAALETLLERYRAKGVRFCARILRGYDDAENVWQVAYLSIPSKIAQICKFAPQPSHNSL